VKPARFARPLLLAALCAAGCSGGGDSDDHYLGGIGYGNLTEPPVIASVNGVATATLTATYSSKASGPVFQYAGNDDVAPTFEVNPGDQISVQYANALPPAGSASAAGLPDNSNLHFHGLTTSPNAPGDDVLDTLLAPGSSTSYNVLVDPDQPPGLYWYHPHPHGETAWQVGHGMAGAIVVNGLENEVPSIGGLRERLILIGEAVAAGDVDAKARAARFCGLDHLPAAQREAFVAAHPLPRRNASTATTITVNGQVAGVPSIGIAPGERELFRVANVTVKRTLDLSVAGERLTLISQDGVPLVDFSGSPSSLAVSDIVVPPGGRAEFIVTGQSSPATFSTLAYDSGPTGDPDPALGLATLVNDGGGSGADLRVPRARKGFRPRPALYRQPLPPPSATQLIHFGENAGGTIFYINGQTFDPSAAPMVVSQSGTVEEWTLENDTTEVHDFHLHQVHFVLESVNGVAVPTAQQHWLDSFMIPYGTVGSDGTLVPGVAKVLVDFRDPVVRGTFVFHCHILDHEDGGMMAKIQVL
jgi:FtsP/CotA-like multicopper oxidase with cupredoxin domain